VLNCFGGDKVPGLLCHRHGFQQIDFIDFLFPSIIEIQGVCTKAPPIECFKALYNAGVTWLHESGHIRFKEFDLNIGRCVFDGTVCAEIVYQETDVAALLFYANIKFLQPSIHSV
jgi:hypothetical protein